MNQNPVTWVPTHTLVLTANDEPVLTDSAVRARVRLIPCEGDPEQVIAARAAIGHPSERAWRVEAPGVLAAMMREAAGWLAEPASALTVAAPEQYRYRAEAIAAEQDPIIQWIEDDTEPDETGERSRTLYEGFVVWCRNGNKHPGQIPTETRWALELTRRGYPARHTRNGKVRALRLRLRGGWPATPVRPEPAQPTKSGVGDGLPPVGDGLVTGSQGNPSQVNPQVNPTISDPVTGVTGSYPSSNTRARAHAHESQSEKALDPSYASQPVTTEGEPPRREPARVDRSGANYAGTVDDARADLIKVFRAEGALTIDVETSGYPVGHKDHQLKTVQLGGAESAWVFDLRGDQFGDGPDFEARALIADLLATVPRLHAHSATADLVPLAAAGLCDESAWTRMYDTVIPAKLADPRSTGADPGLKMLSGTVLGSAAVSPGADAARAALFTARKWRTNVDLVTPVAKSGWAQVDPGDPAMLTYAASDVLDTAALAVRLPWPEPAILERERAVQRVTARVAHRGLRIDAEHVEALRAVHLPARAAVAEVVRSAGIENPGSDRQIATVLTRLGVTLPRTKPSPKFPAGQPSVAAGVLERFRDDPAAGALVRAVLTYRHHDTVLGTFLEPYRQLCVNGDGRARPTIYTLGADTGRMSCVRPNLQQLPREGGVRACITADPGYLIISADFSGVELRVAAALSGDTQLQQMIADGADLHGLIAAQVWGPEWTKADRYAIKRLVFGHIYGGGVAACARGAGVSETIAASAIDVLASFTPGLAQWSQQLRNMARAGAVSMPTEHGRVIHLVRDYPHKAPNYAIQGTARELLVDALERWEQTPWAGGVVLPVHDEVLALVPAEQADAATAELVRCMTSALHGVAIVAQASTPSFAWQDAS